MNDQLRASVTRAPSDWEILNRWQVIATAPSGAYLAAYSPSWPEAMQQAYKLLHDLDRLLMDEVHASRSRRREVTR